MLLALHKMDSSHLLLQGMNVEKEDGSGRKRSVDRYVERAIFRFGGENELPRCPSFESEVDRDAES